MGRSRQRWVKLFAVHRLGGRGQAQGLPLQWWRGGRTPVAFSTVPIVHDGGAYEGGRCGGNPPAQGRAEGPTARNCGS